MLTKLRAIIISVYAGRFRIFSCKPPKMLVLNFFSPKDNRLFPVAYFHGKADFFNHNFGDPNEFAEKTLKSQYREELRDEKSIDGVLKKVNENTDPTQINMIIERIHYLLEDNNSSKLSLENIKCQPQFEQFICQINLDYLAYSDLLVLIEILEKMYVPHTHSLYRKIISRTTEIHKELDFYDLVEIHHFLTKQYECKHDRSEKLASLIEKEILKRLDDRYFLLDPKNKLAAFKYNLFNFVEDKMQKIILDTVSNLSPVEVRDGFNYLSNFLIFTPIDHPLYKTVKEYFFQILDKNLSENLHLSRVTKFALTYAKVVKNRNLTYDPELVTYLFTVAVKFNAKNEDLAFVLMSSSILKQTDFNLLKYAINVVRGDPEFPKRFLFAWRALIQLLANSNRNYEVKERWNAIVPFLADFHVNYGLEITKMMDLKMNVFQIVNLASLGIFQDESLNFLSENIKEQDIPGLGKEFLSNLLILNQAVATLHPSFGKPLLKNEVFEAAIREIQYFNEMVFQKKLNMLNSIQNCFVYLLRSPNCMSMGAYTKFGNFIDGVIAFTHKGTVYKLEGVKELFLEEIKVPLNHRVFAVFVFERRSYCKSTLSISGSKALLLKTLEATGIGTIYVLDDVWYHLDKNKKASFLRNEIIKNLEEFR